MSPTIFPYTYPYYAVSKWNMADMQELEKLISYSATPTAVWRRTGEICYANPEFCSLVKRNEGDLLQGQRDGEKQYIYQLFSKPSYVLLSLIPIPVIRILHLPLPSQIEL
jgi:hypothetical protein